MAYVINWNDLNKTYSRVVTSRSTAFKIYSSIKLVGYQPTISIIVKRGTIK